MTKVPTASPHGPTTLMTLLTSQTLENRKRVTRVLFHFLYNYPPPDNSPQNAEKSCHLSDSSSSTDSLDESSTLSVPDCRNTPTIRQS